MIRKAKTTDKPKKRPVGRPRKMDPGLDPEDSGDALAGGRPEDGGGFTMLQPPLPGFGGNGDEGDTPAPRVGPAVEMTERTRFESPVPDDTLVIPHETFEHLSGFFANIPNRERFEVQVWRCDPDSPVNQRKREWLGRIPLPDKCTLEEAVDREFGGGTYYWRLGAEGRHASREDLPADFQAMPMTGYVRLGTAPKAEEEEAREAKLAEARALASASEKSELLGFLKEMVRDQRANKSGEAGQLTQLMTVILTANQQQMQQAQAQAQQSQQFLMAMLASSERKAGEARESREEMMHVLMDAIKGEATGEKPMGQTIVEQIPRILEGLSKLPALSNPSPRAAAPAPVVPVQAAPTQAVTVKAPQVQVIPPAPPEEYPVLIARATIDCWQRKAPVNVAAEEIEGIGSNENFNDLLDTPQDQVITFLAAGFKAANDQPAPEELLTYARAVLLELHAQYPDEPEKTAPVGAVEVPATEPAAPAGGGTDGK